MCCLVDPRRGHSARGVRGGCGVPADVSNIGTFDLGSPNLFGPTLVHVSVTARTVFDLSPGESATLGTPDVPVERRRRMAELGLRPGEQVRMIRRSVGGARVVQVDEIRIAVDAGTAKSWPIHETAIS